MLLKKAQPLVAHMKTFFLVFLIILLIVSAFTQTAFAMDVTPQCNYERGPIQPVQQSIVQLAENFLHPQSLQQSSPEHQGCCSWHGGVCGCSSARAVCCDGQFSPSCGCD
jgi:hypothetical protein